MSHTCIDPRLLVPAKRATSQELDDSITTVAATSTATSTKDQDKKHTTTSRTSRRLSFKRTRRDTPDSDEDSESDDYTIENNYDGVEDAGSDNGDGEEEEVKAENKDAENVVETLTVQEESKDEEEVEEVDYEAQRKRNILENQRLLQELGLNKSMVRKSFPTVNKSNNYSDEEASSDGEYNDEAGSREPRKGRRVARTKLSWRNSTTAVSTRASKRIRGEAAGDSKVDLEALERSLNSRTGGSNEEGEEITAPPPRLGEYSRSLWKGRKQTTGFTLEIEIPSASVPLTVGSIATTIWELGSIYKGEKNKLKYWSGGGSLFKHPYPIGYRAEKFYFRERYMMHIKEGPEGPIFIVESASGRVFEGSSPTLPWTKVCLASSSKGTRISGPLFFGFSDPITQKMIEGLEGYQSWEQVKAEVQEAEALANGTAEE